MSGKINFTHARDTYSHEYIKQYLQERQRPISRYYMRNLSSFVEQYNKDIDTQKYTEEHDKLFDITPFRIHKYAEELDTLFDITPFRIHKYAEELDTLFDITPFRIYKYADEHDKLFDINTPFTNPEVIEYIDKHKPKNILDEFATKVPCIMLIDDKQIYTNPDFLNVLRKQWSRTK